jgi:hypothetical protein
MFRTEYIVQHLTTNARGHPSPSHPNLFFARSDDIIASISHFLEAVCILRVSSTMLVSGKVRHASRQKTRQIR